MKKTYSAPVMYREAYIAEQYIAASDCGIILKKTPQHGHVQLKSNEWHCAFTATNCGENATSCLAGQTSTAHDEITGTHQIITNEGGTVINKPTTGHNCHILSDNEAAQDFVNTYSDKTCGQGVAVLMGLNSFEDIAKAFS